MISAQDIHRPEAVFEQAAGHNRVVIEGVKPEVDCGQFAVKRVVGERVVVEADIFADGHDQVFCRLLYRGEHDDEWIPVPLRPLGNDRWTGEFRVSSLGSYKYTLEGWVDHFGNWRRDLLNRLTAGQDVGLELLVGAEHIAGAASRAVDQDARRMTEWARILRQDSDRERRKETALREDLLDLVRRYPDPKSITTYEKELTVSVEREKARFSTWYEVFPRSCSPIPGRHGTLRDCEEWLPYIASMGFDVLYLPPIHPIGRSFRKGKNNSEAVQPADVGSPWAIGATEGGHKSVHAELGTLDDFRHLVLKAQEFGLEVALDLAFQCSADHPYVREHTEWFRMRPDGSIQYAENPPKKYQDIYPFDFETDHRMELWRELEGIVEFWISQGVRIFRVDNPHTKPLSFWEHVIRNIRRQHPDVLFLAEAFTRPHLMYRLAKLGFSQSYTYFTWRNTKEDLTNYFRELTETEVAEYFRPNLWPNTPDILTSFLQTGGRPAFLIRLILAASLGASYGIYGPAFELCENTSREAGSEEYVSSEKYELKHRDLNAPASLKDSIARINRIRRDNPALHGDRTLHFHGTDNPALICYSKATEDLSNVILTVVNLDPFHRQSGFVSLDLERLGLDSTATFEAQDLLGGATFRWNGSRNYVELTPESLPAHILRVQNTRAKVDRCSQDGSVATAARGVALAIGDGWRSLFEGAMRDPLETAVLPEYLPKQRWFGGKSRPIRSTHILDWAVLDGQSSALMLVEVRYHSGAPEIYLLPLAIALGKNADQILKTASTVVLSPVITAEGSGALYDATFDDALCMALLALIQDTGEARFRHGVIRGVPGEALAISNIERSDSLGVRRSSAEQSNSSIVYDERFVLKLFRHFQAGPNPDCEIGKYLTERVRFRAIPEFAGSIEYHSEGEEPAAVAMLQAFVANEGDGWKWTLAHINRYYARCATIPFPEKTGKAARELLEMSEQPVPAFTREHVGSYLDSAAALGHRTAELHLALACPSNDPAFSPEPILQPDLEALRNEWLEQAYEVFDLLENDLPKLADEIEKSAVLLLSRRRELQGLFRIPWEEGAYGSRIRIHGDYHLGQVLRTNADYVILDFEGEPARPLAERREKHSPLKDLAGMLRSFSYAALTALMSYSAPQTETFVHLAPWARLWERSVSAEFLRGYRETAGGARFLPAQPSNFRRLLAGYWLDKAIYEMHYELNHRPTWVRIPLVGILSPPF